MGNPPVPGQPYITAADSAGNTMPPSAPSEALDALGGDQGSQLPSQIAVNANAAAASMSAPHAPGAWARGILAGAMDALAGAGAGGRVPPGAGALYGAGAAAREIGARNDQQKQRKFENQQKLTEQQRQQQIAQATIAHENAATMHEQQLSSTLDFDNRQKNVTAGQMAIQPYVNSGAPVIQEGLTSDEIQRMIQEKKLNPRQQHAFATGQVPVLDANGKEEMDDAGNVIMRPTYTIVGDVPEVEIDEPTSRLLSQFTHHQIPVGSKMSGLVYGTLVQNALSARTAQAAADQQLKKTGLDAANLEGDTEALKFRPQWASMLGAAKGDIQKAYTSLSQSDPAKAAIVPRIYGGDNQFQTVMEKQQEDFEKAKQDKLKQQAGDDYTGNENAATPQEFLASLSPDAQAVVRQIGEGRAPISRPDYLLARKPEIIGAVEKAYPGFDGSKVLSYAKTYQDFTSGKTSIALNSGATVAQHLAELRKLNTNTARVPGTKDYNAYQNKVDTIAAELGRFYENDTVSGIEGYKKTLNAFLNRDSSITTQGKSMADKFTSYEQEWNNAAPSKAYEAPIPGWSDAAKDALTSLQLPMGNGRAIDPATIKMYLDAAGNDPVKATRIAELNGWKPQ